MKKHICCIPDYYDVTGLNTMEILSAYKYAIENNIKEHLIFFYNKSILDDLARYIINEKGEL